MIETLTPFCVGSEQSRRRSGCFAGQRAVIGKTERSAIPMLSALRFFLIEQSGYCRSYPRNRRLRTETVADFEVSLLWHIRTDNDPAQAWFRDVVAEAVAALRTGRR